MLISENEHPRCEVQFEYGLLGKRAYPLRERPRSFTSAFGKEIRIDNTVGAQNDVITRKGKVSLSTSDSIFANNHLFRLSTKSWNEKSSLRKSSSKSHPLKNDGLYGKFAEAVPLIFIHWCVRLSNMLVCLKGMGLEGFTVCFRLTGFQFNYLASSSAKCPCLA